MALSRETLTDSGSASVGAQRFSKQCASVKGSQDFRSFVHTVSPFAEIRGTIAPQG